MKTILSILSVLLLAIVFVYFGDNKEKEAVEEGIGESILPDESARFCFLRFAHLVCVDEKGEEYKRYDLPKIDNEEIRSLISSPSGKQYIARFTSGDEWLLNNNLELVKKINTDSYNPAWSYDEKYLFRIKTREQRSIVKYSLETEESEVLLALTSERNGFRPVCHTEEGNLVYQDRRNNKVFINNVNDADYYIDVFKELNVFSVNYDQKTNTLIADGIDEENNSVIAYINITDVLNGKDPKVFKITFSDYSLGGVSSADNILRINSKRVIVKDDIFNIQMGERMMTIKNGGEMVGVNLDESKFKLSADQEEQVLDRVARSDLAPLDFQNFIKSNFNQMIGSSSNCSMTIRTVARDSFVLAFQGCFFGGEAYYVKVDGTWELVYQTQQEPECWVVDKYNMPEEIAPECY